MDGLTDEQSIPANPNREMEGESRRGRARRGILQFT